MLSFVEERSLLQCNGFNHSAFALNGQVVKGPVVLFLRAWTTDAGQPPAIWRNPADRTRLVWIPPGGYQAEALGESDVASPELRLVTFTNGFWMGRTEVTVAQFRRFARLTGHVTEAEKATNQ